MADTRVVSYDARDVIVTWGDIPIDGAGDDAVVNIEYANNAVEYTAGAQGFGVATVMADQSGTVTCSTSQGSPVNDRLSAIAQLQRQPGYGLVKKALQVKHINGTTLATGTAWIEKVPGTQFSKNHQNREWMFRVHGLDLFVGGSTR